MWIKWAFLVAICVISLFGDPDAVRAGDTKPKTKPPPTTTTTVKPVDKKTSTIVIHPNATIDYCHNTTAWAPIRNQLLNQTNVLRATAKYPALQISKKAEDAICAWFAANDKTPEKLSSLRYDYKDYSQNLYINWRRTSTNVFREFNLHHAVVDEFQKTPQWVAEPYRKLTDDEWKSTTAVGFGMFARPKQLKGKGSKETGVRVWLVAYYELPKGFNPQNSKKN